MSTVRDGGVVNNKGARKSPSTGRIPVGSMSAIGATGPFDSCDSSMEAALEKNIIDNRGNVLLDLQSVTYISAMGIGVLFKAVKRARAAGGKLFVRGATQDMIRLMRLAGLDGHVQILMNGTSAAKKPARPPVGAAPQNVPVSAHNPLRHVVGTN